MKKSMLTALLAASAVMAFAAPIEVARIDVYNLSKSAGPKDAGSGTTLTVADKGTTYFVSPKERIYKNPKTQLEGKGVHTTFKINGADWQTGTVTLTAVGSGRLLIRLMGPYFLDPETKKLLKMQVDFKKVMVNGKTVYEGKNGNFVTVWHNKPYRIEKDIRVKDGDTVKIEATFRPSAKE